ncbi:hypothetical protein B2J88_12725 [Rhodococcus sp. SRB_17]|nr:hypothetical protein [Rhodococcus sp. SRB_17]
MIRTAASTDTLPNEWASVISRRSVVARWATAAFFIPTCVAMIIFGHPYSPLCVLTLMMAAVSSAMIHHRSLARYLQIDHTPVLTRPGETVIRSSVTSQTIVLTAAMTFTATGAILVHTVMIAMNPENRAVSVRVKTDGITMNRGFHRHMRWDQVISIEPIEEQKTSLIPSYSIRIAYREDPTGSGRRSVRVRRYTWHGIWISTDPVATLHALHTYWSRADLRSELGARASITRFTEPTPLSDGNRQ